MKRLLISIVWNQDLPHNFRFQNITVSDITIFGKISETELRWDSCNCHSVDAQAQKMSHGLDGESITILCSLLDHPTIWVCYWSIFYILETCYFICYIFIQFAFHYNFINHVRNSFSVSTCCGRPLKARLYNFEDVVHEELRILKTL